MDSFDRQEFVPDGASNHSQDYSRGRRGRGGGFRSSFSSEMGSWNDHGGERGAFRGRGGRGRGFGGNDEKQFSGANSTQDNDFSGERRGRGSRGEGAGRGGFGGGYRGKNEEIFTQDNKESEGPENPDGSVRPKVTYVPPALPEDEDSVFAHYQQGINFDKYDDILVDVSGTNPASAILTFDEAALCESLRKNISKSGYSKPTPVQKHAIPIISAGRDLMACAQTGSGKTAAFLLPILQQLMADGVAASSFSELQEPEAIIVAPTRELINQIFLEARKFAYGTCVRPVVVYGGVNTRFQLREISKGCNIVCGTPGRLLDVIGRGRVDMFARIGPRISLQTTKRQVFHVSCGAPLHFSLIGLTKLRYLVLDEADRMLDMGFEPDMRRLVSSPGMPPKENRQTLLFSATYPEDIQRLAADFLKMDYLFLAVGIVGGACSDVEQTFVQVTKFSKREQLLDVLKTTGNERTMVFVETKRQADFIATFLCQEKLPTTSIHGDREQREREQALADFRTGKCPVLVATSVAARGLDIPDVQHVVNFDLPNNIDEYVHRIGRTGRCGNIGRAVSFYDPENDNQLARSLITILSKARQVVPSWLEESAFSGGATGFNLSNKGFASSDSRKFKQAGGERSQPLPQVAVADDDDWE
ncbi:probable ATP-dependent RNA helicase DDX4 isoform X3 [Phyllopteryx taeniolatus]|uniref:probable ATP-dependent RNA helicase DDX4 isoform X3 n=1 Tax=Phyllopteryx taeniolatus TaxID=161469 RepID=UPI002AD3E057|nr:probable ATP-dependent RNA helicase DDX4 isoform X3 [Phyllopteryx taeniolatus]